MKARNFKNVCDFFSVSVISTRLYIGPCPLESCSIARIHWHSEFLCQVLRLRSQLVTSVRSKPFTEDTVLLNGILEHLWPHISQSVAKSLAGELEPSIRLALSKLPSPLNKCSVKDNSHLGTKPVRILAPAAAWSSTSSFTISGRLEWDSNSSISLSFTGASLAIINFFIMGDFTIELLLVPGKSAAEFVSAVRAFFPYPPDAQC